MVQKKNRKKRSFIITFCIVALCAYFAISLFSIEKDIADTKKQIVAVEQEQTAQKAKNDELRQQINSGNIKDYAESIARDNGYVMPGERVYYDTSVSN